MTISSIQYLGHSAILLHANNFTIAIDPWLKGNPSCPDAYHNPERLDLILLTHGHSDHAGDCIRLAKKYNCKIAATFELCNLLVKAGARQDQILYMNKGGTIEHKSYKITLCHAQHSSSFDLDDQTYYAGEACGVIVQDSKNTFYHAGDTELFSDLSLISTRFKPNYAFLPIGDRFTMGPEDAAIAAKLLNVEYCVPIHHSTFELLTGKVDSFINFCKDSGTKVLALKAGEIYAI